MSGKKQTGPQFGAEIKKIMAQPITMPRMPLTIKEDSDEWNSFLARTHDYVLSQRLKKMEHLAQHYGLKNDSLGLFSQAKLFALVLFLATDCIRGFQTIVDGERTGKRGRPPKLGVIHDKRLLPHFLELVKTLSGAKTDEHAGQHIAEMFEGLKGPANKTAREKRGQTLAKRASEGRKRMKAH